MDLSALIFVALAVAWAVYLIPKALKQHEDSAASRSIDGFSDRLRVLARREPVSSTTARLVVSGARSEQDTAVRVSLDVARAAPRSAANSHREVSARRAAAALAARRRLRVVLAILGALVVVATLAAIGVLAPSSTLVPAGLLVAWLVTCRLMVRSERAVDTLASPATTAESSSVLAGLTGLTDLSGSSADHDPSTEEIDVVHIEADLVVPAATSPAPDPTRSGDWDPVPVTLPTYVAKEQAVRRTVRTIDLDSTGVWTSGPLAADSELAREADAAERTAKDAAEADRRRASGS